MSVHLIFLFLFQGGLAFAFSYFIARVLVDGAVGESRSSMLRGICKIRLVVVISSVVLPLVMFAAYYKSLPEDASVSLALWPAAWILVILLSVVAALTLAMQRPGRTPPGT